MRVSDVSVSKCRNKPWDRWWPDDHIGHLLDHHNAVRRYRRPFVSSKCQCSRGWVDRAFGDSDGGANSFLLVNDSVGALLHQAELMVSSDMAANDVGR